MKPFAYVKAANEQQALAALGRERGKVMPLAGGMDLVSLLKDHIATPERLVNVKGLDGDDHGDAGRRPADRRGRATRRPCRARGRSGKLYPALIAAAAEVGTPQIRNLGTVGGNLMQRPRCWYFRNEEFPCLKKGGARCYAVEGENQFHAIFGDGPVPHRPSVEPGRAAHRLRRASSRIAGPAGRREVDRRRVLRAAESQPVWRDGAAAERTADARHPAAARPAKSATYEVRFKQSHDWPIAFASVALLLHGTTVKSARVVLGAVAPIPWRSPAAEPC